MNRREVNRIALIFFHLYLLITPLVIKGAHTHAHENDHCEASGVLITEADGPCFICNFEFVSIITPNQLNYCVVLPSGSLEGILPYTCNYKTSFNFYSHRAPPIVVS